MKKTILKALTLALLLVTSAIILAGCGNKEDSKKEKNSNKQNEVISTSDEKVVHAEYVGADNYDSELEMTFSKDNKLTKFVLKFDCATEEAAQAFYDASLLDSEETDTDMKIDGKKVTIIMSAEGFMKMSGLTEDQLDEGTMRQVALGMKYNTLD